MSISAFPKHIHCVGIKGSGVSALAVLLAREGHTISGSDTSDVFFTDVILRAAGISWSTGFSPDNIPPATQLVIYSPAYSTRNNTELAHANQLRIPCVSYPEALGTISSFRPAYAVIGTHGKTTTTAFIGALCKAGNVPVTVLAGSAVSNFQTLNLEDDKNAIAHIPISGSSILHNGSDALFAEVCEYKNHFAHFHPAGAVYTGAELDHPDFFISEEHVRRVFADFLQKLPDGAPLVFCADDEGARETMVSLQKSNHCATLAIMAYGSNARALQNTAAAMKQTVTTVLIENQSVETYRGAPVWGFNIRGFSPAVDTLRWYIGFPTDVLIQNAVAALCLIFSYSRERGMPIDLQPCRDALARIGSFACPMVRRCEILYQNNGIIIIDDYAHHPTAIQKTLDGLRDFYKPARLIVNFMPHTYTRTRALWNDFTTCFSAADEIIINDVYGSARETTPEKNAAMTASANEACYNVRYGGAELARDISGHGKNARHISNLRNTATYMRKHLCQGDLFITMGAGDNFKVSHKLAQHFREQPITTQQR